MNEIIQNLEANVTNGKEIFCYISENKLQAIKELSKREQQEKENLIKYIEDRLNQEIENETEYGHARDVGMYFAYQDILERIKNNNYES